MADFWRICIAQIVYLCNCADVQAVSSRIGRYHILYALLFVLICSGNCFTLAFEGIGRILSRPFEKEFEYKYSDQERACLTLENTPEIISDPGIVPKPESRAIRSTALYIGIILDAATGAGLIYAASTEGQALLAAAGTVYVAWSFRGFENLKDDLKPHQATPRWREGWPIEEGHYYYSVERGCKGSTRYQYRIYNAGPMDNRTVSGLSYEERAARCTERFMDQSIRLMELNESNFNRANIDPKHSGCWQNASHQLCFCRVSYHPQHH